MPQYRTKVASLSTELSSYSATFTARGLALAGESRSDGTFAVVATRTVGGSLRAVGEGASVKDACNDAASRVGIPGSPTFP
jgi:hypothetical protein